MKNILLLAVIMAFASCSDEVYSYRHKIRVSKETAQLPVKETAKETMTASAVSEEPGSAAAPAPLSSDEAKIDLAPAAAASAVAADNTMKPAKSEKQIVSRKELKKLIRSGKHELKERIAPASGKAISGSPRSLIIIGLVVLLIGIVLYVVSGVLGWVFTSIGAILIVIGLILYLLDVL